jgi:hypothetical protein
MLLFDILYNCKYIIDVKNNVGILFTLRKETESKIKIS